MSEPVWLKLEAILALHDETIATHGGRPGVRDLGLLDSALARPLNAYAYQTETRIPALAANYAYGIAQNHPFTDGNKRAAFLAAAVFLEVNGFCLSASEMEAAQTFLALAAGEMKEAELAVWITANSAPKS